MLSPFPHFAICQLITVPASALIPKERLDDPKQCPTCCKALARSYKAISAAE